MAMQLPTSVDVRAFVRRVLHRVEAGEDHAVVRLSGAGAGGAAGHSPFAVGDDVERLGQLHQRAVRCLCAADGLALGAAKTAVAAAQSADRHLRFHRRDSADAAGAGALLAAYLFAGQFATYAAMSDLQSELQHLDATNRSLATQFRALARDGKLNQQLAGEIASASDENFRHRSVSIWEGEKGFVLAEPAQATMPPIKASPALPGDFAGFVLDNNRLHLRAVRRVDDGQRHLTIVSNLPVTAELLRHATSELGEITLFRPTRKRVTNRVR